MKFPGSRIEAAVHDLSTDLVRKASVNAVIVPADSGLRNLVAVHQLGLNHERLTYKYAGRNFRLTDVAGRVVDEVLS